MAGPVSPRTHSNGCATASRTGLRTAKSTTSPLERAEALWCRRSRSEPSLSARTKRPARSSSVCEHRDSRAGGARLIPTFSGRGRDQPATRADGKQAAEAEDHRTQRALIRGNAHAHLQAGRAHRGHAVADAAEHASSARTEMEITTTDVSIMLSEVSNALSTSTKPRACTQHAPSVEVGPVPVGGPRTKSGDRTQAPAPCIAAMARRTFFDSRAKLSGQR